MNLELSQQLCEAIKGKEDQDIVIIGKGSSIDRVSLASLSKMIVINANDSEAIFAGDIGVFHHGWVLDRFEQTSPQCQLYVTDRELPAGIAKKLHAQYSPFNSEDSGLFIERFFDNKPLWLESAVVISCLRVANEIAKALGKRKRVFLLGFDFSAQQGFSTKIVDKLHGADSAYVEQMVGNQEKYLERLLEEKEQLSIDIVHVGNRPYSMLTVEAFNALHEPTVKITPSDSHSDKQKSKVIIVAEITTNHFGDKDRLRAMILLAKKAGADYIKLQKRNVETFYSAEALNKPYKSPFGKTFRDYRLGIELSEDDFWWVDQFCKEVGIGWFASILDEPSYDFIKRFNPSLIKLPSTISEKKSYLEKVGNDWHGGLVISTGMTGPEYEDFIFNSFRKASQLYLLQCTSAYPAPENDTGVGIIRHYRDLSKKDSRIIPGYSSHDIGALCSQLAVAAGALMIEKHVKLGSVQWAHFDGVAVDLATEDFRKFVDEVRRAERIAGSEEKVIFASEHHKY